MYNNKMAGTCKYFYFISGVMVYIQETLELCIFNWYGERL